MPVHSFRAPPQHSGSQTPRRDLVRRSKSLTAADIDSIIADINPTARKRSFFSTKKPKVPADPAATPAAVKATPRSFSGLLPSQLGASQDGADTGGRSFVVHNIRSGDADGGSSSSKPKSSKWWSWATNKAPPKPDAKAMSDSAPSWGVDSSSHSAHPGTALASLLLLGCHVLLCLSSHVALIRLASVKLLWGTCRLTSYTYD